MSLFFVGLRENIFSWLVLLPAARCMAIDLNALKFVQTCYLRFYVLTILEEK